MIDADLFDEFVKSAKRGRRLDRAGLDPRVVAELDRYLSWGRAAVAAASKALPTLPPIYADFVTNPQFNAFAFKHRDRYFIAFHDGLPLVLLTVLYRLLADRRVLRHVGEPQRCTRAVAKAYREGGPRTDPSTMLRRVPHSPVCSG